MEAPNGNLPVQHESQVDLDVTSPRGSWLTLAEPFDPAWRLAGREPVANLGVTTMFSGPFPTGTAHVTYSRWPVVRDSYLMSGAIVLLVLIALIVLTPIMNARFRTLFALRSSK